MCFIYIKIDISEDEFANYCRNILTTEFKTVKGSIIKAIDHCFEISIQNTDKLSNVVFLDRGCDFAADKFNKLDDYIAEGSCKFSWYKMRFDCVKDSGFDDISFLLPDYIMLENNYEGHNYIYVKKKVLKTKEQFHIQIVRLSIDKSILEKINNSLPENFFRRYLSILGGEKAATIDNIVSEEDLPFPIVLYPGSTGIFFAFKKDIKSEMYFCSCAKEAIRNYINMRLSGESLSYRLLSNDLNLPIINSNFPFEFRKTMQVQSIKRDISIIECFKFHDDICHICNRTVPAYQYSIPFTKFAFRYGWYIKKQSLEYGIDPVNHILILSDKCPEHIKELFNIDLSGIIEYFNDLQKKFSISGEKYDSEFISIQKLIKNKQRIIRNSIENDVRKKLGYKVIGEEWVSETILFYKIKQAFPDLNIIHHGKPDWLGRQHIDIWIPDIKFAIEYQGIQHYESVKHFGGDKGLENNLKRDERKRKLCEENGVKLLYVDVGYNIKDVIDYIGLCII